MATRSVSFAVVDATDPTTPVTGDADNISLSVITDNVAVPYSGSITELTPGEYGIEVDEAGAMQSVVGTSTTANAIVIPARWQNAPAVGAVTITSGGTNLVNGDLQIEVPRGDSYSLVVEAKDEAGDAVDLSSYDDFLFTVKAIRFRGEAYDDNALFQVAGTLSGSGNNVLTFAITPAHTELGDLGVWYDCDIEAADTTRSNVRTLLIGRYKTTLDVTRGALAP